MSFFHIGKVVWYAVEPSHLLIWGLVVGSMLALLGRRTGAIICSACALFCLLLLILPIGNWVLRPLENSVPRPLLPGRVDGILVLGEGLNGDILHSRRTPGLEHGAASLVAAMALARRFPAARVVFSGGAGDLNPEGQTEAAVAAKTFSENGLAHSRLLLEGKSRSTWENLVFSRALANPTSRQVWVLVASAAHMPRALAVARKVGWAMVPWPSNYLTTREGLEAHLSFSSNLNHLDLAAHEWLGLMAYRASGKAI
ncbi:MAG: YdcF family protein [Alphaproteobacteria bacterium]|nr:YdcF family protein [Alphaproteobacteria bacterium]